METTSNPPESLSGEEWLPYDAGYYISSYGRWYSQKSGIILKQYRNSSGYLRVRLYLNGKSKDVFTHIKVVATFGDCQGEILTTTKLFEFGESIDHLNGNQCDNRRENLEIVQHKENIQRKLRRALLCKQQTKQ